jgi:Cro/C1-type HTH DNA-binding domain
MNTIVEVMTLEQLLRKHGILAASELRRRIVDANNQPLLSRAQAHALWRGKAGIGKATMRLLHDQLGISYDELMEVDPVPRRPKRQSPPEGEGQTP